MSCCSEKVIKKQLISRNYIYYNENCDQYVFSECRNIKPKGLDIYTKQTNCNWQVGFFDADGEVHFDQIVLENNASFSSIVRNYWWNGKEGKEKKEGYYSLIKTVKELKIKEKHINDLLDYVEGRYKVGKHQRLHKLDRNIKLIIDRRLKGTTVERLSKYFDNIRYDETIADLKTENNITYNCGGYLFENCDRIVPKKLVINITVKQIRFHDVNNEVRIPEIVMEENADLKNIIQNKYGYYWSERYYSLLPHVQTLVIKNNLKVLCDLADYITGRYKMNNNWQLHELNKNMKIVIERPGIAFDVVKQISDYFSDVLVNNNKSEQYLTRQQPYQKSFKEHFDKYNLETDWIRNLVPASQELKLEGRKFNIGGNSRKINRLCVNQKLAPQQFVCFHDTGKLVVIDKIVIESDGDLRCVLQNAYYSGTDSGFFSLLKTAKELEIHSNYTRDNQVLIDLADYIEGKYALNANWKQEQLDKDMRIEIDDCEYDQFLNVTKRLRKHFKSISIDRIWAPLDTKNIINQNCEDCYIFTGSRKTNPQKLVINANLMNKQIINWTLIQFNDADCEVHIPEITIDEQGYFAAILHNRWQNNKEDNEYKHGNFSLVQHIEKLIIRNNPGALKNFADYVIMSLDQKLQQHSKDIRIVVESPGSAFLPVLRISNHFNEVTVDGKQPENYLTTQELWNDLGYKTFRTCFGEYGLLAEPLQYGVEAQKKLKLVDRIYNIRKSVDNIDSLTVGQKLDVNQFVCFHNIDKPITVDKIIIDDFGDLRSVLQNAYYSNGQAGFFSLLETAKELEIYYNKQAMEDLTDYVDGKYTLHPKWGIQTLNKDMEIKISYNNSAFPLHVTKKLRNHFKNVSVDCIKTPLKTENVIDQKCKDGYIFTNCRDTNPQKLVINAKLTGSQSLIMFDDADGEVSIPEITIGEHGSFDAIVHNKQWNGKEASKNSFYSLISHVKILTIQNNPEAVYYLDNYVSGNYEIQQGYWKVQKINKNVIIKINGVKSLHIQIYRLKEYFGYIFIDDRKSLGVSLQQMLADINSKNVDICQRQVENNQKQQNIDNSVASIQDVKWRIEKARDRLGRRRARFQEYLALAE